MNLTISSLKINLSDRRIGLLLEFVDNLPLPTSNTVPVNVFNSGSIDKDKLNCFINDKMTGEYKTTQLATLKRKLVIAHLNKDRYVVFYYFESKI